MIRVVNVRGLRGDTRKGVCYVGRAWAGWPESKWGNPYKPKSYGIGGQDCAIQKRHHDNEVARCLGQFYQYAKKQPSDWLAELWEACEHGTKPLGCWCVNATHGDGTSVVCHAQILAELLAERYAKENADEVVV